MGRCSMRFLLAILLAFLLTLVCLLALTRLEPGLLDVYESHRRLHGSFGVLLQPTCRDRFRCLCWSCRLTSGK